MVLDNQAEAERSAQLEESIGDEDTATRIHPERPDLLEAGMVSEGDRWSRSESEDLGYKDLASSHGVDSESDNERAQNRKNAAIKQAAVSVHWW